MFITLNNLKTALTAVLNIIGNKMEKKNPSASGLFSLNKNTDVNDGDYAHVVSIEDGTNVHTLDWQGNAEFAGNITANGSNVLTNANFVLEGTTLTITTL